MNPVSAILKKQLKDTLKNKTILIQFLLFPVLTLIMNGTMTMDGIPENFFVNLFAVMYVGMAPLTSMAAIIAEEKEKNTLRVLILSNVRPFEYLLGTGLSVWAVCMAGAAVICAAGRYTPQERAAFLAIMAAGILISLLSGALIGVLSRTEMMASSISIPVMMIFSFLPMLALFNPAVDRIAGLTYTGQISRMIGQIGSLQLRAENAGIIAANALAAVMIFRAVYRKYGLT